MPNREASGPTPLQGPGATRLEAVERLRRQLADLESGDARSRPDSPRRIRPAAKRAKSEGDSRGVWRSDGGPIDHEASDPSYQGDAGFSGAEEADDGQWSSDVRRRSVDGYREDDRGRTDSAVADYDHDSSPGRPFVSESSGDGSDRGRRRGAGLAERSGAEDHERPEESGRRGRRRARRGGDGAGESAGGGTEAQAKDICLRLLTDRARSRAELANKLADKGFRAAVVERVLNRLAEVGLIDDAAFAEQWVHSRHTYSGRGKKVLAQELRRKGVAPADSEPALAGITSADEHVRATELVHRKLQSLPADLDRDKAIRRLVGMLGRRGYEPSTAYAVVMAAVAEAGLESEPIRPQPATRPDTTMDESAARELVRRKLRTMPGDLEREKTIRRLVGMLARRGYNQSAAYALVKDALAQAD